MSITVPIARHGTRGASTGRWRCQPRGATFLRRSRTGAAACGRRPPWPRLDSRETAPGRGPRGSWAGHDRAACSAVMRSALQDRATGPGRDPPSPIGASPRGRDAARLGGSQRDAQGRRHVGQRHSQQVVQCDDRSMARVEALERRVHELAIGEGAGLIGRRRRSIGVGSTSIGRRRRLRATSREAFTVRRWSQASNRSGSRSPGRSRQARMSVSWTASRASSWSRRMSRAAASSRASDGSTSWAKAS